MYGCHDARELLRYEAVLLEEMIHQVLLDVNEKQGQLERERANAAERWEAKDVHHSHWLTLSLLRPCTYMLKLLRLDPPYRLFGPSGFRWQRLIDAEEQAQNGLSSEISEHQSDLAKVSMNIRGLRVPLVEPQPPKVSQIVRGG